LPGMGGSRSKDHDKLEPLPVPDAEVIRDSKDIYRLTYDEGRLALEDQKLELTNMRTRMVQFLAFVGSATAFLVGAALHDIQSLGNWRAAAIIATVLAVGAVLLNCYALNPWLAKNWKYSASPKYIIGQWVEREVPHPSEAEMLRDLSLFYDDWREVNDHILLRTQWAYLTSIGAGSLQLVLWTVIVVFHG
jgi:hypothetical protein